MRRTRKHNKNLRRTRRARGGGGGDLKKLPPLPPSPPPSPPRTPNTKKPSVKVENNNLKKVEPHTYNWWKRYGRQIALQKQYIKNGFKPVSVNSTGHPIQSYFKPGNSF